MESISKIDMTYNKKAICLLFPSSSLAIKLVHHSYSSTLIRGRSYLLVLMVFFIVVILPTLFLGCRLTYLIIAFWNDFNYIDLHIFSIIFSLLSIIVGMSSWILTTFCSLEISWIFFGITVFSGAIFFHNLFSILREM